MGISVKLTRITGDPILAIEEAASNCYDTIPTGDGKIMKRCIKSGHTSVTEFCDLTFHIEGVSRALSHQLVRHRIASYAQRSQRYCSEDGFNYVTPYTIKGNEAAIVIYEKIMKDLAFNYKLLQELGIPNEDARMILPNACETQLEVKMNLRTFMNFMNERLCSCAQWEIRLLAQMMRSLVIKEVPELEPYLVPKCEKNGKEFGACNESKSRSCGRHPRLEEIFEDYHNYKDMCES